MVAKKYSPCKINPVLRECGMEFIAAWNSSSKSVRRPRREASNEMSTESIPQVNDDCPVSDTVPCDENLEQDEHQMRVFADQVQSPAAASRPLQRMNGTNFNTCDMELDSEILVSSMKEIPMTVVAENRDGDAEEFGVNSTTCDDSNSCMTALRQNQPECDLSRITAAERTTIDSTVALGLDEETVPNKYEMIRRYVESLMPCSAVHIYGSQLYDPNDASNDLNLYIDCGKEQYLYSHRSMVFNVASRPHV